MPVQERKDCWTAQDDSILASIVLEHIRSGSTQLRAFDEAGERLERTSAACGFRWNSEVRKHYEQEISKAKQERIAGRKKTAKLPFSIPKLVESAATPASHPLFAAIKIIDQYVSSEMNQSLQTSEVEGMQELKERLEEKERELESLRKQLDEAREAEYAVTEDYKMLLRILERARSLGVINHAEDEAKAAFKMDANGNLERIG